jgi:hypothetical protein
MEYLDIYLNILLFQSTQSGSQNQNGEFFHVTASSTYLRKIKINNYFEARSWTSGSEIIYWAGFCWRTVPRRASATGG